MLLKVLVLAVAVGATLAQQCGVPAIKPISRLDAVIAHLTGKSDGRIVGGVEARPHTWPWQVGLLSSGSGSHYDRQFCGGSILNKDWVMSAAHCCVDRSGVTKPVSSIKILVGAHNLASSSEQSAKVVNVARNVPHPRYVRSQTQNDFCLLKLAEPLAFSAEVSPVCLADATDGPAGQNCHVTGWGSLDQDIWRSTRATYPTNLQQVDVAIIDQQECVKIYGAAGRLISPQMVCARNPGKDSCGGDSGGPFVCQSGPGAPYKMVGVVSWGFGCADPKYPGVYARTSEALDWVAITIA